ncbi:MAG: PqqD family peptide modification chaperone [Sphaerotilus sp.]|nr:PqqD family peptide modification chaperone [Sphaerotilus sp.]
MTDTPTADAWLHPHWYRVAPLKPRLRGHVRLQRQITRGERWMLLTDGLSQRTHRLDAAAWALVGRCNGERTVQRLWETLLDEQGDDAPTQAEVIDLLAHLQQAGLLQAPIETLAGHPHPLQPDHGWQPPRPRALVHAANPLYFQVTLGDPSALVRRLEQWLHPLLQPALLVLWALGVAAAGLAALADGTALAAHGRHWLSHPHHLGLLWVVYPVMKLLHETAHALAIHRFGGEVRAFGLTMVLFTPVPHVDARAASALVGRGERLLVSLAGIMAELAMAAVALVVWQHTQNGLLHDLAFVVMFLGAVSSLLVNGNPLLRMDGYHALCDALDLPNLAARSRRWWLRVGSRVVNGPAYAAPPPACAPGERGWLIAYAPLSWLYRAALSVVIVRWLGGVHAGLGLVAAAVLGGLVVGLPLRGLWQQLNAPMLAVSVRRVALGRVAGIAVAVLAFLFGWPLPHGTTVQGVVWLPEPAWIRPGTDGFVTTAPTPAAASRRVRAGELVLPLADDRLVTRRGALDEQLAGLEARRFGALARDPGEAAALQQQAAALRTRRQQLDTEIAGLAVRAPLSGTLVLDDANRLAGRWLHRGAAIGHVRPDDNRTVQVVLPHEEAQLVQQALQGITLRPRDQPARVVTARLRTSTLPAATRRLPVRSLGDTGGGQVVTDPADPQGLTSRDPVSVLELVSEQPLGERIGGRVWVRFAFAPQPMAWQIGRWLRQTFLGQFEARG